MFLLIKISTNSMIRAKHMFSCDGDVFVAMDVILKFL